VNAQRIRHIRARGRAVAGVVMAGFLLGLGLVATLPRVASAQPAAAGVSSVPISFQVRNVNNSKVPCVTDGATYTVRGHLVTPSSTSTSAVTLYLHGLGLGESFWDFSTVGPVAGYNYSDSLARAGHSSVVIDRLGYGKSDKPGGTQICFGSQADIAHQMVQDLRTGNYTLGGAQAPMRYSTVVLAGHSVGGLITQIESYSFADADGYIVMDWADRGASALTMADLAQWTKACAAGGTHVNGVSGPGGYAPFATPAMTPATFFYRADPAIVRFALSQMVRDPCGDATSIKAAIATDLANLAQVHRPVLVLFGTKDALFPPPDGTQQTALFTGSSSVSYAQIPGASHAITLEPEHAQVGTTVASWLSNHISVPPAGAPSTGGGSTAGVRDRGLLGFGGAAVLSGLGVAAWAVTSSRRRRSTGSPTR